MSANNPPYPQYPAPVHPPSSRDDDAKAPYDDLIDQYASPYGSQAHKTYAVDPAPFNHARQPSYPLSKQSHETSADSKSHGYEVPDWEYPPQLAKDALVNERKDRSCASVRSPTLTPELAS